jgi:ribose transport system permease protein
LWALFIVVFAIWVPSTFLTPITVHSIASQQAVAGIVAIAVLVPMAAGCYDLSVGATANLAAIFVSVLQVNHGWGPWSAIAVTVAMSAAIGVVNGFIVVKLKVNSFIATLGAASIITAVQSITSGQVQPLPPASGTWLNLAQRPVFGFQIVFFYLIVIGIVVWWAMEHTPAGRYIHAVGGNTEAARLSGVRTGKWTWITLIVSATLSGIGGVLFASLTGPSLTFGNALLLPAFAAVFLGSTQITPGRVNVWGTLLAMFALATGIQGLLLVTGVQWLPDMFNGVAVITAVAFAVWRQRRTASGSHPKVDRPRSGGSPDKATRTRTGGARDKDQVTIQ